MSPLALALPLAFVVGVVVDEEPGFGGASAAEAAAPTALDVANGDLQAREDDVDAAAPSTAPSTASLPAWKPPAGEERDDEPTTTKLELELQKAQLDPQRYPLLQLRVDLARLALKLDLAERKGLAAARDVEERWVEARALLADVERVAMFRMNRCAERAGRRSAIKTWRVTAGGAVALTTDELVAQASALDAPGCARIDLIDAAVVEKVRRARFLKATLPKMNFSFHELDRRRALEDELAALKKELAAEGGPALLVDGDRGYSR